MDLPKFNLSGLSATPCEPVKRLVYVIATGEVISEAESEYREQEPLFKSYKQLDDEISLEWFCSDELIKFYEKWDCKNLEKYKPSKSEIDLLKLKSKEIKNLPTNALLKTAKELCDLQKNSLSQKAMDALKNSPHQKAMDALKNTPHQKAMDALKNTPHQRAMDALNNTPHQKALDIIARLSTPEYVTKIAEAQSINKLMTPAYLESTKTALNAFNNNFSHRDMLSLVNQYTDLTDQILNTGINAQIAWDMLEPHKIVTENLQFCLRSYEPEEPKESEETTEQLKEIIENKDEQLDFKDKEIAELKASLATSKKQEKRIEKQTRVNQLHTLIRKVDVALTNDGIPPTAQAVWNEIEKNHDVYDDETIIQEVKENTIFWKSKGGKEQSLSITSFTATLSAIRKKY